jgi:hypothetical protein
MLSPLQGVFRGTLGVLLLAAAAFCGPGDRVLLAPFKSGSVYVYDLEKQSRIATLPAEDSAGVVGIAVSTGAKSVFLVDGNTRGRVRRIDTQTWRQDQEQEFRDRVLALGGAQLIHATGDNRWVLIKTYDMGAAAHGIRVFDVQNGRFAPVGLAVSHCSQPLFASARDGSLAAVCPGFVEFLSTKEGETMARGRELPVGIRQPSLPVMSPQGDALFLAEVRDPDVPWQLTRISLRPEQRVESWKLASLLNGAAKAEGQSTLMTIDETGTTLAIVSGPQVWLVNTRTMRQRQALRMAGPLSAVEFSADARVLYTVRRDDAKRTLLLGRTDVESGNTRESVLLENLPLTAVIVRFAIATKDTP